MKIYPMTWAAIILANVLTIATATAQTQDSSMVQSVRLERAFSPIVQQKNKIDRQPALQAVQQKTANATYAKWSVDAVRSAEIGIVPAGQVIAHPSDDDRRGYLELSAGNFFNTDLKAGIKARDFRLDGKGFFTRGKLELPHNVLQEDGTSRTMDWKSRLLNGDLTGTYSHTLDNDAQFEAHLGMGGTSVNTFNYRFYQNNDSVMEQAADKPGKQHWGQVRADASYETDQLFLSMGYDFTHLTTPDSIPVDGWYTNTLLFKARYGWYENDRCHFSMGMDMGGVFGKEKSYFIIHPDLHLSLMPEAGAWRRIYFDLGFGSRRTALMDLMERLPLAYIAEEYKSSVDAFRLKIGYEDNEQGYLRWGAEILLNSVKDDLGAVAVPMKDGLYMQVVQEDCFHFGLNGHVDYEYNQFFGAKAGIGLLTHSCETKGMGEPRLNMSLHALAHPGPVTLDFGLDMGFARKMQFLNQYDELEEYNLGADVDFNIRADWQCNRDWRLFFWFSDIIGGYGEFCPGVPEQNITFHAGFNWQF